LKTAAGNPLALLEIPRLLGEDELRGSDALDDPLPVGATIERAYLQQVASLPGPARDALVVAAASDAGDLSTVRRALRGRGLDPAALEAAERSELIRIVDGKITFAHPLLRSAVFHSAAAPEQRAAHAALADALAEGFEAQRAWHRAAAAFAPDEEVAAELERAALSTRARSGYAAAARALERAATLTVDPGRRARRLVAAAESLELTGDQVRALDVLSRALRYAVDPRVRADVQHARGRIESARGNVVQARERLLAEGERVAGVDRAKAAAMLSEAAMLSFWSEQREAAIDVARRAVDLVQGTREARGPKLVLDALLVEWMDPLTVEGGRDGLPSFDDVEPLLTKLDPPLERLLKTLVAGLIRVGSGDTALRLATRAVDYAREAGAFGALPGALLARARWEEWSGAWDAARADTAEALDLATEAGQTATVVESLHALGFLAVHQGRQGDAEAAFSQASQLMQATGWGEDHISSYGFGRLALSVGRPDEAIVALEPATFDERGRLRHRSALAYDLVEAYLRTGRLQAARATLEQMLSRPWPAGNPRLCVTRCRALLAGPDDFDSCSTRRSPRIPTRPPSSAREPSFVTASGSDARSGERRHGAGYAQPSRASTASVQRLGPIVRARSSPRQERRRAAARRLSAIG
jgi:tetratricopeptide (TPR) repeat protein